METDKYLRKHSTMGGSPLYLTRIKGKIRGIQVTRADKIITSKYIYLSSKITPTAQPNKVDIRTAKDEETSILNA